ncbi:T9SS C-terminal target domain-containing protein [Pontibacter diazotrophicus]|uniref:T9SS C-terminal target domain-containing protein n=1 Tax=Pontibacter diazotrophicus TaxID=1400979 RepID=A0A3D8LAL8_9BACT|nr:choice-of-anchor D domain-containing protein [Pontibacter diazotrophicus]RDV14430.1 T9SS C-terminal target domain-containing protein [Pontibacter diazotrophicus]
MAQVYPPPRKNRLLLSLLLQCLFMIGFVTQSFAQATLPTSNTSWSILPQGWTSSGVGEYATNVPTTNAGENSSASYTASATYVQIDFTGVPDKVSFNLRASGLSGKFDGVFQVLESSTVGSGYTAVGDNIDSNSGVLAGSSNSYPVERALSSTTKSVRLYMQTKGVKTLYLDNAQITAVPAGPEVNMKIAGANFLSGSTHNFGTVNLKKSKTVEVTIENIGTSTLSLDPPVLTGVNPQHYSITTVGYAASLEPSQTATFQVTFSPTVVGTLNAEVQVANNDSDENPYKILLQGTGAILQPVITSLSSYLGGVDKEIIIEGSEFINVDKVQFSNGVTASFTIISDTQIRTFVPAGAVDGPITVSAGALNTNSESFDVVPTPEISSVNPAEAYELDVVTISGSYLTYLDLETVVSFNGVRATFTVRQDSNGNTVIDATVPVGATTGPLTVTTPGGTDTINFTVLYKTPIITAVDPSAAYELAVVTISGTNLRGVTAVTFNGVGAAFEESVDPNGNTIIYAEVPLGATTGPLTVTTLGGTASIEFTVLKPIPANLTINPTSGRVGDYVIISGDNLADVTSVVFTGGAAATFAAITNSDGSVSLQAQVPAGAETGAITVSNANGSATTPTYTVIKPTITSVDPPAAYELEIVTITGTYLSGVTAVIFNGVGAAFEEDPASNGTIVYAEVPLGATTGPLTVTTADGTASIEFTVLKPVPSNLTISPTSGRVGDYVIISGDNLADVTSVVFTGGAAATFAAITNSDGSVSLQAQVPAGAETGAITVSNANGSATTPTYTVIKPTITSVDPPAAYELEIVTITGTYLSGVTAVIFNGVGAAFEEDPASNGTIVYAEVPLGATTGPLTVTTADGTASIEFTVLKPVPSNLTISPTSGRVGDYVIISGDNLSDVTSVVFTGGAAAAFAAITNSDGSVSLQAQVPVGAETGAITVSNVNGSGSTPTYTVLVPKITLSTTEMTFSNVEEGSSAIQQYEVSAEYLNDGAGVTLDVSGVPGPYTISLSPTEGFGNTINITEGIVNNTLELTTIYVKFSPVDETSSTTATIVHVTEDADAEELYITGSVTPLPVELIFFKAAVQGNKALLTWETASEQDNSHFEVETSLSGVSFEKVGRVDSKTTNSSIRTSYAFTHNMGNASGTRYYRLKQVDLDGTFAYSKVVAVTGRAQGAALQVLVAPNPINYNSKVYITVDASGKAAVTLHDLTGKQLYQKTVDVREGQTEIQLPLYDQLPSGLFMLTVEMNGLRRQVKVVKQ